MTRIKFQRGNSSDLNNHISLEINKDIVSIKERLKLQQNKKNDINVTSPKKEVILNKKENNNKTHLYQKPILLEQEIWDNIFPADIDDVTNNAIQLMMGSVDINDAFKQSNVNVIKKKNYQIFKGIFEIFWPLMGGGTKTQLKIRRKENIPEHILVLSGCLIHDLNRKPNLNFDFTNRSYHIENCLVCGKPIDDIRTAINIPSKDGILDSIHRSCKIEPIIEQYEKYININSIEILKKQKETEVEIEQFWKQSDEDLLKDDIEIEKIGLEAWYLNKTKIDNQ
jgi:hypothetical protein